jgi:XTP/dITP diphosphohydrolase
MKVRGEKTFVGFIEFIGFIAFEEMGRHGFGYDPLFLIPKYGKTFGQLGLKVKDRMSHRSKALKKARAFLKKYL